MQLRPDREIHDNFDFRLGELHIVFGRFMIKKKRADVDSIVLETKEMSPSKVKFVLQKLCDSEKLILMNRRGLSSYRF